MLSPVKNSLFALLAMILSSSLAAQDEQPKKSELPPATSQQKTDDSSLLSRKSSELTPPPNGIRFGREVKFKWKVGIRIATAGSSFDNVEFTMPIPVDWPEQSVKLLDEKVPPEMGEVKFRELNSRVKQIRTVLRTIPSRTLLEFEQTYLITIRAVEPPEDTSQFQLIKPLPREFREYLGVGPQITYRKGKVRTTVNAVVKDIDTPWAKAEAIYDWISENIEFRDGENQSTDETVKLGAGNAEDIAGLFVAMCRCVKIPARMVWVDGHQYAEFCLWDQEKKPHWFPVNVAGLKEFASYSDPRVIQQKGDNIKIPGQKQRVKFVPEFVTGKGKSRPKVQFIRELTPVK